MFLFMLVPQLAAARRNFLVSRLGLRNNEQLPPGARAHDSRRVIHIHICIHVHHNSTNNNSVQPQTTQWHATPRSEHNELRLPQLPARCLPTPPKMRVSRLLCIVTNVFVWTVNANTEKAIFLGPSPVALSTLSNAPPSLDALRLDSLLPVHGSSIVATQLPVRFPTVSAPRGEESWYLLRGLEDGRRYEVRICWSATVSVNLFCLALAVLLPCLSLRATIRLTHAQATHRLLAGHV
jgi:hypothetical protein